MSRKTLGISAFYHDSAAVLLNEAQIVAAAQEERFSRTKHDAAFPASAVRYCLNTAGCDLSEIDAVVFYESPQLKHSRQMDTFLRTAPRGLSNFKRFGRRFFTDGADFTDRIRSELSKISPDGHFIGRIVSGQHHTSHAASAFYPSPFDEATIVTVDGVGEWETTTISTGRGNKIEKLASLSFPHSLGLIYSVFTSYCGFKVNDGEYKLMGLAPYGEAKFKDRICANLIDIKADGSFKLNMKFFDFATGNRMFNAEFEALFGGPSRRRDESITQRHMDVAASIQAVTEEVMLALVENAVKRTGIKRLCLAGGVALNCVANGKLLRSGIIEDLWIQPAAGDAGGALGCALHHYYTLPQAPRTLQTPDAMDGSRLGPEYTLRQIAKNLTNTGAVFTTLSDTDLIEQTAEALAQGEVVGWFDGRMEFGPRALGGRSILADPRRTDMQRVLNLKVKFRESFRPFAPIVLAEEASKWFDLEEESPYMLIVAPVGSKHRTAARSQDDEAKGFSRLSVPRSSIPAVTHVDYSARIQTVDRARNTKLHALLRAFERRTQVPILVNTSFNVNDEPIVCSPLDAYRCFVKTEIDRLVIGNHVLIRSEQPQAAIDRAEATVKIPEGQTPDDFTYTLM